MGHGLQLARRRRRRWVWPLLLAALAGFLCLIGGRTALAALGDALVPRYTARLAYLQQQNASLRAQLALCADARAENAAFRSLLDCGRTLPSAAPARVLLRLPGGAVVAGRYAVGRAVLDRQGRFAGRITGADADRSTVAWAGTEACPAAGLADGCAGLLQANGGWHLTGLPLDGTAEAGTAAATPDGFWLGSFAAAPVPDSAGLTQSVPLQDTADLWDCLYFVAG